MITDTYICIMSYCTLYYLSLIFDCIIGIAAIFTIFASFVFGSGIVYFVDSSAAGLRYVY